MDIRVRPGRAKRVADRSGPCRFLQKATGKSEVCKTCKGSVKLKLFGCAKFGDCTPETKLPDHACCKGCVAYEPLPENVRGFHGMKSPKDKRATYHGGILQIHLTRACDRSCFACTQGSNFGGKTEFMTPDQFKLAVDSLRSYFGVVGIFGGNPCISPYFEEICSILRGSVPWKQRGLWSNHPLGKGKVCAVTFNPAVSNLNVHESQEAYDEFARDWPESKSFLKGLDCDSRHRPPFVELNQMVTDESERWKLIRACKINAEWSAMIAIFRGELRGWFCELAGAQSILNADDPNYPDTGHRIEPNWWNKPIDAFEEQINWHCHRCGIPLPSEGILANEGEAEIISLGYERIAKPKRPGRQVLTLLEPTSGIGQPQREVIRYLENGRP